MTDEYPVTRPGFIYAMIAIGLLAVVGFGYTLYPTFKGMSDQNALRTEGVKAPAKILSVLQTRHRLNHDWVFDLELHVRPPGGKPYWAKVSQPFAVIHVPNLRKGAEVTVRFDSTDRKRLVVISTGDSAAPPEPAAQAAPEPAEQAAQAAPEPAEQTAAHTVDPVCAATTRCCLAVMGASGAASCNGFSAKGMNATACAAALPTYLAAAKKSGVNCE